MKPVIIIVIVVGISVAAIFVTGEIVWYFANQEFEEVREEFKESLEKPFEEQDKPTSEQRESTPEPVVEPAIESFEDPFEDPFEEISGIETSKSEPTEDCSGTAKCITGTVTEIIDGDTIKVDGQSIRFALVDAPELKRDGGAARDFIEVLCPVGSTVIVDQDDSQLEDKYGRMLGVIYCNDLNLNSESLDSGIGDLYSAFCDQSEFATHSWAQKHGCVEETTNDCDPSYPDFCIPSSPPDLDCGDISQKRFIVLQPDPHRFDGDNDGIGCES